MTQVTTSNPAPLAASTAASAESTSVASRFADYSILTKPRITLLVVITAYIGFGLGAETLPGGWNWVALIGMLVGTALSCMGASVFNQVYERDTDALMKRTANRPLAAGRMSLREAVIAGSLMSVVGVVLLWVTSNGLAASASAFTILTYAAVYTPMKRTTTLAVWVGAVPGAMPPIIGYAAATETIGLPAVLVFAIMFLWQIPHFLAIAWLYRDDYARAGLRMLPVVDPDGGSTFRQIVATAFVLLPLCLLPTLIGITGLVYFAVAMICGWVFIYYALTLVLNPTHDRARRLFFASLIHLPVVLAAMLVG